MTGKWGVPAYRNAFFWRYSAQKVECNFAGCWAVYDQKKFWTRAAAEKRAADLNLIDSWHRYGP